jgi:hypothetical protein
LDLLVQSVRDIVKKFYNIDFSKLAAHKKELDDKKLLHEKLGQVKHLTKLFFFVEIS